jgi:hypothetical protein
MSQERIDQLTAVLAFTNQLSDEAKRRASFAASNDTITDAQAIADGKKQVEEFVSSRSLKGTHPRSSIGMTEEEKKIAQETRAWVARKDKRMRGA